jgi:hypothetical protein
VGVVVVSLVLGPVLLLTSIIIIELYMVSFLLFSFSLDFGAIFLMSEIMFLMPLSRSYMLLGSVPFCVTENNAGGFLSGSGPLHFLCINILEGGYATVLF